MSHFNLAKIFGEVHRALESLRVDRQLQDEAVRLSRTYYRLAEGFADPAPGFHEVHDLIKSCLPHLQNHSYYGQLVYELSSLEM